MSKGCTLGIMQPYFFPYLGYWQLLNYVDKYVLYDDIQFIKSGYVNRNAFLMNGEAQRFTINLVKDSDQKYICERSVSTIWREKDSKKFLRQVEQSYRKYAPLYASVYPILEKIVNYENNNLFEYVAHSIQEICAYIGITTPIIASSTLDHKDYAGEEKVLEICRLLDAEIYVNAIGGKSLYHQDRFAARLVELKFLKANLTPYPQGKAGRFVPYLSILDILMWNDSAAVGQLLNDFSLVN